MPQLEDKYFTAREAARIAGISQSSMNHACLQGEIKLTEIVGFAAPMISSSALLEFVDRRFELYSNPYFRRRKMRMFPPDAVRRNLRAMERIPR